MASSDTCGTCGEEHRTSECGNKEKTYCVSCKSNTHTSWDRECPEFRRRCDQFDKNYPENNLPYFPSEERWMLIPRPSKIPRAEKFPAKYAVAAIQNPEHTDCGALTKNQSRHPKQRAPKVPPNQSTMDQYITTGNTKIAELDIQVSSNNADATAFTEMFPPLNYNNPKEGCEPQGWD